MNGTLQLKILPNWLKFSISPQNILLLAIIFAELGLEFLLNTGFGECLEEIFFHYGHLEGDSSKKFGCEQKKIARAGDLEGQN